MDEAALQNYQNMHTAEERATFFKSIHLFPVCDHHRLRLLSSLLWTNVKIVVGGPPEAVGGVRQQAIWEAELLGHYGLGS